MFVPFYSATGISAILDKLVNALVNNDGGWFTESLWLKVLRCLSHVSVGQSVSAFGKDVGSSPTGDENFEVFFNYLFDYLFIYLFRYPTRESETFCFSFPMSDLILNTICPLLCSKVGPFYKLLFLGHGSLIKNKTQTMVIKMENKRISYAKQHTFSKVITTFENCRLCSFPSLIPRSLMTLSHQLKWHKKWKKKPEIEVQKWRCHQRRALEVFKHEANLQKGGWAVQPVNHKCQGVPMEAFDWLTCQTKRDVLSSRTFSHY